MAGTMKSLSELHKFPTAREQLGLEEQIKDILGDRPSFVKDVSTHHIGADACELCATPLVNSICPRCSIDPFKQEPLVLPKEIPTNVTNMLNAFVKQWTETANLCDERADALERVVSEFRRRATSLRNACNIIPSDIIETVHLEMESHERSFYTSAVNPLPD